MIGQSNPSLPDRVRASQSVAREKGQRVIGATVEVSEEVLKKQLETSDRSGGQAVGWDYGRRRILTGQGEKNIFGFGRLAQFLMGP